MKRLPFILLGLSILLCACKRMCPAYPTDQIEYAYAPFKYGGSVLTYRSTDGSSIINFKCSVPVFSEANKQPYCAKCVCEMRAEQILQSNSDSSAIHYTHSITSIGEDYMEQTGLYYITGKIGKIPIDGEGGGYWRNYERLPEWTSADGTRYENVYHLVPDDGTALYLAPGYGIVQIEAADKTYCLKP